MLRMNHALQYRISNRLAMLAVILLIAATLAGVSSPLNRAGDADRTVSVEQPADSGSTATVNNKAFRVGLFLFRRN